MTTLLNVSPDALDAFVDCGDALINFSFEMFPCSVPFVAFSREGQATLKYGAAMPVGNQVRAESVRDLLTEDVRRFVIISDGSAAATAFAMCLEQENIPHAVFLLTDDCAADSFMDEEDSDAVAGRLRQLGYI